jgi:hypothetical protein
MNRSSASPVRDYRAGPLNKHHPERRMTGRFTRIG